MNLLILLQQFTFFNFKTSKLNAIIYSNVAPKDVLTQEKELVALGASVAAKRLIASYKSIIHTKHKLEMVTAQQESMEFLLSRINYF